MFKAIRYGAALIAAACSVLLAGCEATALAPGAGQIIASPNPPPKGCKYVGQVTGNQGNFFTGGFTSNANLEQGAINTMKNQAVPLGGNYIQLITNRAGVTGSRDGSQQTNVTMTGNVYKCKNLDT